jgi:hypothetical protein
MMSKRLKLTPGSRYPAGRLKTIALFVLTVRLLTNTGVLVWEFEVYPLVSQV